MAARVFDLRVGGVMPVAVRMQVRKRWQGGGAAVIVSAALVLAAAGPLRAGEEAPAEASPAPKAELEVYGFGQVDYVQDFGRVDPSWNDSLRPSRIPTTPGAFGSDNESIFSVRQSRLGTKGWLHTSHGTVMAFVEFDFYGVGSDAGKTTPRLRHAWGEWRWLGGGQTHSLFMDIDVFPNTIDYWGPSGMVFLRNPQIRITPIRGDTTVAVAAERPSSDIDVGQYRDIAPEFGANAVGKTEMPDFTAHVRHDGGWGHVQVAGIVRRLGYETLNQPGNDPSGSKMGWGFNASSNIKLWERDRIILMAVYGRGIASYMNDGGVDLAPDSDGARAVPLWSYVAYFDHYWTDSLSSSVGYSRTQVENTDLQQPSAFRHGQYASGNLLWSPVSNGLVGIEYLWGRRTDFGGAHGDDHRLQLTVKYSFSLKLQR